MKNFVLIIFFTVVFANINAQPHNNEVVSDSFGDKNYVNLQLEIENELIENLPETKFQIYNEWWQNILFLVYFIIFTLFYVKFNKEINVVFDAFLNKNTFNRIVISQNSSYNNILIVFNLLFLILISSLFFRILKDLTPYNDYPSLLFFVSILFFVFVFYMSKLIAARIWGFIFEDKSFFKIFQVNLKIANLIQSIFLLIILFIATYNANIEPHLVNFSFFVIIITFLIRAFNIFREFFSKGFLFLYLILYLCTVEILPVLLFYRYLLFGLQ